ncbi:hypothetical protein CR51_27040 [Caballeronia megalochromosomata]|nr:hypothetical protein CR51_27040 [Caballeronia megalochromosomata]
MKTPSFVITDKVVVNFNAPSPRVVKIVKSVRPVSTYATLLQGPIGMLAGHALDRPDVQSVAVLGYN